MQEDIKRRKSSKAGKEDRKMSIDIGKYELNEETIQKSLKEVSDELKTQFL